MDTLAKDSWYTAAALWGEEGEERREEGDRCQQVVSGAGGKEGRTCNSRGRIGQASRPEGINCEKKRGCKHGQASKLRACLRWRVCLPERSLQVVAEFVYSSRKLLHAKKEHLTAASMGPPQIHTRTHTYKHARIHTHKHTQWLRSGRLFPAMPQRPGRIPRPPGGANSKSRVTQRHTAYVRAGWVS